jgi:predicted ATPase/DNA-binding SARP family transcriptional activator
VEAAHPPGIAFRVLGAVEALRDGTPLPLGGPRQQALLALLLLEPGRSISADRLIDELWAGEPPDGAETTLRSYVSRLRSGLGGDAAITGTNAGYAIDVDPDRLDARRFEAEVRAAEAHLAERKARRAAAHVREALARWRGEPYGGLADVASLRSEADRLNELRIRAKELQFEVDLALGASADLVDELEAAVRDHPYREAFWRQLMLALYRAERQADALAAYHRARAALDDQLGLEPSEQLRALEAAILRHEVPPATPPEVHHNLPAPITSFVGREAELAEVGRLLARHRLLTLSGVGGVGKTRLATEAARAALDDFADGVWFVDLAPLSDASLVPALVGTVLQVREQAGVPPAEALIRQLRTSSLLLVLDNCEHVRAAGADLAARLLEACPSVKVLATSREVLRVPGEVDYAVPPLSLPMARDRASARGSEAVQLFLARARDSRPGLRDDDRTLETVARICSDLDGLPLGIELAAARARALSPDEIAERLRDRFRFLVSWRRLTSARHRTLREAMDWSYDLLESGEQRTLRALSVFAGGFTLDALSAVGFDGDESRALEALERLIEASLVSVDPSLEPTRYRILETVRQYGAQQLEEAGETADVRDRHARYYAGFAIDAWWPLRTSGLQAAWVARLAQERDNIRAAMTWSRDSGQHDQMLRMAEAVWWFWWIRGDLTEGRSLLTSSLDLATQSDEFIRGRASLGAAGLAWAQADYDVATTYGEVARKIFADLGNAIYEGSALNTLGLVAHGSHDQQRARALFEEALERYRVPGVDPDHAQRNTAVTTDNLGSVAHELHEDDLALQLYREARAINEARGDVEGVAMNDLHISILDAEAGRWLEARQRLAHALPVYRDASFLQYASETLEVASGMANHAGAPRTAAVLLGAAGRFREQSGTPPVPFMGDLRQRELALARAALGDSAMDAALDEGGRMPFEVAMDYATEFLAS